MDTSQERGFRGVRVLLSVATAILVIALVIVAENLAIRALYPNAGRVATDFSPTYLERKLDALAAGPHPIIFLGDSVWWGFGLPAGQNAIAILRARGCDTCVNLAFKSGSPVNDYALVRLLQTHGIVPKAVFLEINLKVFNPVDVSDQQLHPAIAALALPLIGASDRALLSPLPAATPRANRFETALTSLSALYAMRTDIRQSLFGDDAPPPATHLTPADFEGTYDLEALDGDNVAVHFLEKTVELLQAQRIPAIAVMTPTNRALVGKYVGTPEYRANLAYLTALLQRHGVRVLNLDGALPPEDFIDNAHLLPQGQQQLATLLAAALPPHAIDKGDSTK